MQSQWPRGLRPLACWVCGLESRREHGCLSPQNGVSLVQRIPTQCVCECVCVCVCVAKCDQTQQ
jgi:hypothetical protein